MEKKLSCLFFLSPTKKKTITSEELGPKCIYFQGVYFEPEPGGKVRIFGSHNNKQTNKPTS